MPNWCENTLVVTGKKQDIDKFYDRCYVSGDFQMLESFIPTPKELLEETHDYINENSAILSNIENVKDENKKKLIEKYGCSDWYAWRVNNWGTKWDIANPRLIKHEKDTESDIETIVFIFDTAWAPPVYGLMNISKQSNGLLFYLDYKEPGMGFAGFVEIINGEEIASREVEMYPNVDDHIDFAVEEFERISSQV